MNNVPNLYSFATKELAQDATLAYILAWARPAYRESYPRLHQLGTALLHALIGETDVPTVTSLDVETQVDRIDVLVRVNDENENGLVLVVEDKVGTHEHSDQINRYIETAENHYPNRKIVPVYMKTMNASQQKLPPKEKCRRFLRRDLLNVLDQFPNTGDTIVENFHVHLQGWEDKTNRYRDVHVSKWKCDTWRYEGFYAELEDRMTKESGWNCSGWGYSANPAGGVLWFAFAEQKPHEVAMYLQIENGRLKIESGTRLTVRLSDWSESGIRAQWMHEVLRRLKKDARQAGDIKIKKAGRFRGGSTAAVAEVTFGDDDQESYLALTDRGTVDMDATMRHLDRAREFVAKAAGEILS